MATCAAQRLQQGTSLTAVDSAQQQQQHCSTMSTAAAALRGRTASALARCLLLVQLAWRWQQCSSTLLRLEEQRQPAQGCLSEEQPASAYWILPRSMRDPLLWRIFGVPGQLLGPLN